MYKKMTWMSKSTQWLEMTLYIIFRCVTSHLDLVLKPLDTNKNFPPPMNIVFSGLVPWVQYSNGDLQHLQQHMNLSFTDPVTGILQNILLQNMIYINSNTSIHATFFTHWHVSTSHSYILSNDLSSRSLQKNKFRTFPFQSVSPLLVPLTKPCLTSFSKQTASFWEPHADPCGAMGLVFDWLPVSSLSKAALTGVTPHSQLLIACRTHKVWRLQETFFHYFLFCTIKKFRMAFKNVSKHAYSWSFWCAKIWLRLGWHFQVKRMHSG